MGCLVLNNKCTSIHPLKKIIYLFCLNKTLYAFLAIYYYLYIHNISYISLIYNLCFLVNAPSLILDAFNCMLFGATAPARRSIKGSGFATFSSVSNLSHSRGSSNAAVVTRPTLCSEDKQVKQTKLIVYFLIYPSPFRIA